MADSTPVINKKRKERESRRRKCRLSINYFLPSSDIWSNVSRQPSESSSVSRGEQLEIFLILILSWNQRNTGPTESEKYSNNHSPHPDNDNEQSWMHGEALQPISLCPRQLIPLLHLSRPLRARMHLTMHLTMHQCTILISTLHLSRPLRVRSNASYNALYSFHYKCKCTFNAIILATYTVL